jgi:hypothetical protein
MTANVAACSCLQLDASLGSWKTLGSLYVEIPPHEKVF